ncbi:MAG: type III secretion system gatekeeper subunit SctW [Kiritimatiellae bacterium]|nr:type III secretion system gatekeeper subunit SctW [Kiritimatiellia bacterium]
MAMDAAQILRHALSTQYDVAARQGEALDRAAQSAQTAPAAETGRAMGVAFEVEADPMADLMDSMEELTAQFEEKSLKKLADRKLGSAQGSRSAFVRAMEAWAKLLPDMPGRDQLDRLLRSARQARAAGTPMSADSLLRELGRSSTDATHQFAMLDLLEQMLGESEGDLAQLVKDARAQLMAEKGPDVKAGLNLAQEVNARATTPDEMQGLRDLYRSEVFGFTKPQECFRSLLAARGEAGLKDAISFLLAGCGADLAASNPSMDPAQLRQILLDLQCVDVLQTVLGDLDKLGARMQLQFGEACRLTGQQMTGRVLDFTEEAFVTSAGIGAFVGETGVQALLARMDFSRELVALFRRLSPRLFGKETDRQKLVDAAQEHLDGLISLEEEAEQEKQEAAS